MSKKLRIGVIGAGRIGKLHANNLASRVPNAELAAISDVYEPAARELAEKLNVPAWYSDYHKILEDPTIDAVFICSSTDTHSPISIEAARGQAYRLRKAHRPRSGQDPPGAGGSEEGRRPLSGGLQPPV